MEVEDLGSRLNLGLGLGLRLGLDTSDIWNGGCEGEKRGERVRQSL